jgi:hypothetical protein
MASLSNTVRGVIVDGNLLGEEFTQAEIVGYAIGIADSEIVTKALILCTLDDLLYAVQALTRNREHQRELESQRNELLKKLRSE